MDAGGASYNVLLFLVFPYLALALFFVGSIWRYKRDKFTYSSLSTQLLENQQHFWAVVPFHVGILWVLLGHFVAFLIPRQILAWNEHPLRLYVLEISALAGGLMCLVGVLAVLVRRLTNSKVRHVTTTMDWVVYLSLLLQFISGVWIALFLPWGSSWFASVMAPYLWSIFKFQPVIEAMAAAPWIVKVHVVNASVLVLLTPFSRLVHVLVVPFGYFFRKKPEIVRWWRPLPDRPVASS